MRLVQRLSAGRPLALIASLFLFGCPQRYEIKSHFWNQSGLPKKLCGENPEIAKSGLYRRLNDDQCGSQKPPCYQFVSYCNPSIVRYLPILDTELNEMLDQYVGPEHQ